jgi:hypothetical protein
MSDMLFCGKGLICTANTRRPSARVRVHNAQHAEREGAGAECVRQVFVFPQAPRAAPDEWVAGASSNEGGRARRGAPKPRQAQERKPLRRRRGAGAPPRPRHRMDRLGVIIKKEGGAGGDGTGRNGQGGARLHTWPCGRQASMILDVKLLSAPLTAPSSRAPPCGASRRVNGLCIARARGLACSTYIGLRELLAHGAAVVGQLCRRWLALRRLHARERVRGLDAFLECATAASRASGATLTPALARKERTHAFTMPARFLSASRRMTMSVRART